MVNKKKQSDENGNEELEEIQLYMTISYEAFSLETTKLNILDRMCADDNERNISMEISSKKDVMNMLKQISKCCSQKDEYITIHTSITEGVIREILAAANKPINSEKVSTSLRNRWALTPFPKSIDKNIIEKIAKSNKWIATSTNEV